MEMPLNRTDSKFLLELVNFVEEQDNATFAKPFRTADTIKQCKCLLNSVYTFVFEERLIILGDGNEEEDCGHILKAVYPLLPF